jgi:D-alanyl-D-alanine dipeptidase
MKKSLLLVGLLSLSGVAQTLDTQQLIVVKTQNWSAPSGMLQRYEKANKAWHKVGDAIAIHVGRNGLGWGVGLHTTPKDAKIIKKEGDGKAPAGVFALKQAFGYFDFKTHYPYRVYKRTNHCVDDVNSRLYNKIVDSTKISVDYKSKEHMRFAKNYYKYGIVVNHNHIDEAGAIKGAGSCIFIHIKPTSTAGCTVMNEAQMKTLIGWLDAKKHPMLVQGTVGVVDGLMKGIR